MNDFTKLELQIIAIELNINFNRGKARHLTVPQSMMDLIKKVNMMIDNYCNHDKRPYESYVSVFQMKCLKCDKVFEDE